MKKKTISALILTCVAAVGVTYFILPRENVGDKALAALVQGDAYHATRLLEEASQKELSFPLALYRSYVAQSEGNFKESDYFLGLILNQPPKQHHREVIAETYLAKTINAFFSNRDGDIPSLVADADRYFPGNPFSQFFEGLSHYLHDRHAEALTFWSAFSTDRAEAENGWMYALVEKYFPLSWRRLHMAHCMTSEGELLAGRSILEKESHELSANQSELQDLATLFLGLSYLKESKELPLHEKESYYKLARFYFERTTLRDQFEREQMSVSNYIAAETKDLLSPTMPDYLRHWGYQLVHTLHEWKEEALLREIASQMVQSMSVDGAKETVLMCQEVKEHFQGSDFHALVEEELLGRIKGCMHSGEMEPLSGMWSFLAHLSASPKERAHDVAHLTSEEMFHTIYQDDMSLRKTRTYLAFWKHLGQGRREYHNMAQDLLRHAELFWKKEGQEQKATRLMDLALEMSLAPGAIETKIEKYLTTLYEQAESSNMIARLSLIHDALSHFSITVKEIAAPEKLANHLADAEYLYQSRNWLAAKAHASWVLKLDPSNMRALRLVGLSSFQMGDYTLALSHLSQISDQDETVYKACAFSQIYQEQDTKRHLVQIDNVAAFED